MAEKTIAGIYGHDVSTLMLADDWYAPRETQGEVAPNLIVGVELEIEKWESRAAAMGGWRYTDDGSLRNNGRELISNPIKTKYLRQELNTIFRTHAISEGNYSERCSTHVHMNVQDYTVTQLKTLCILYQIVERLLFEFIGNERKENIFCVPWYESGVTPRLVEKLTRNANTTVAQWVKYTALNLLPVVDKGTVEFRHLHGTCDTTLIMNWVSLIARLHLYAQKMSPRDLTAMVLSMNTVSNYDMFLGDVFGEQTGLLTRLPHYREELSVGVVDAKLMMLKPHKVEKKTLGDILADADRATIARPRARPVTPPNPFIFADVDDMFEPVHVEPPIDANVRLAALEAQWEMLRRRSDLMPAGPTREMFQAQMREIDVMIVDIRETNRAQGVAR